MMQDRIVLFACDTSRPRPASVAVATRLARRSAARLMFLCVVPLDPTAGDAGLNACVTLADTPERQRFFALRPTDPRVPWLHRFELGAPEVRIAQLQAALGAEMVVLDVARRSWAERILATSLAERLRERLGCPLVVVPRRAPAPPVPAAALRRGRLHPIEATDMLNASVDARMRALVGWMDAMAAAVASIARDRALDAAMTQRRRDGDGPWARLSIAARLDRALHTTLEEHRCALGALGWQVRRAGRPRIGQALNVLPSPARDAFVRRMTATGSSTSLPLALADNPDGLAIVCGAHLPNHPDAALMLWFDARDDFLRILGQPGRGPTFETYAFDASGLMLSNSRFPDHLHQRGLLPSTDAQTPLRLRVCEPGVAPRGQWPLTRMAAEATCSRDGVDVGGYPDYRGTEVVGAWRWVDRYGFGMTAEIDKSEVRRGR